jgi:type 1 glutamine amidotransferase
MRSLFQIEEPHVKNMLTLAVLCLLVVSGGHAAEGQDRKIRVLVYGGGVIHDFRGIHAAVMDLLKSHPQLEVTGLTDTFLPFPPAAPGTRPLQVLRCALDNMIARLPQCDVLFFHYTGGRLTPEQEKAFCDAIGSGKGFVGIHSAADSFKQNKTYMDMIGGMFRTHPAYQGIPVTVLDENHPITRGLPKNFTVKDEQYILKYDPNVKVLCDAPYKIPEYSTRTETRGGKEVKVRVPTGKVSEEGRMPAVWTKPWQKGRVVYISLGHDAPAVKQELVGKLILQGILWAGQR